MSANSTIFMPLSWGETRPCAAEAKQYRPVTAEAIGEDVFRVTMPQPGDETWEYPTGSTVYAITLHPNDAARVIVAPFSPPASPADAEPAATRSGAAALRAYGVDVARVLIFAAALTACAAIALGWLGRASRFVVHPADPIQASVVAGLVVIMFALWRVQIWRDLRAVLPALAIVAGTFALSLITARSI